MLIEARGKRDPALAARMKAGILPGEETGAVEYVVGRRQLKVGEETRQPGDPIPEAAGWPRLESWLRSGAVVQRPVTHRTVSKPPSSTPRNPVPPPGDEAPARPVLRPRKGVVKHEHEDHPVLRPARHRAAGAA